MPLKIVPLNLASTDTAAELSIGAFGHYPPHRVTYPNSTSQASLAEEKKRFEGELTGPCAGPNPTCWHAVVIDDKDGYSPDKPLNILAYAVWALTKPSPTAKDDLIARFKPSADANSDAFYTLVGRGFSMRDQAMGTEAPYLFVTLVATVPHMRRKGLATMLLAHIQQQAKGMNMPIFLRASGEGVGVYKRVGFRIVYEDKIDLRPWVVEGDSRYDGLRYDNFVSTGMRWDAPTGS